METSKMKKCLNCGKRIDTEKKWSIQRKFCSPKCNAHYNEQLRKQKANKRCIDCEKLICEISERCLSCFVIYRRKCTGELNPAYKGIKRYCLDCGKKLKYNTKRCIRCARKGKLHPNFKNWKSREEYGADFSEELKQKIRKRDNYTCQECSKTQKKVGYKLSVHHIDYNKKNNNQNNLISLCRKCHTKTNYKRKDWIKYYKEKVKCQR